MKTVHDHDSQNHNRASDRREDAFCVAEPRLAVASLAYQLADMAQTVPGHDSIFIRKKTRGFLVSFFVYTELIIYVR